MIKYLLIVLILVNSIFSQEFLDKADDPRPSYGLYGMGGLNLHVSDFTRLPQTPGCCDGYKTGAGVGYNLGLFYDYPLSDYFELDFRLGLMDISAVLKKTEETDNKVLDVVSDTYVNATIEHQIDATLNGVVFEPMLVFKLSKNLRFRAGISGMFLLTKDFTQQSEITSPSRGVFLDTISGLRSRITDQLTGEIPEAPSLNLGITFGASYDLKLNKNSTWFLVPEARYTIGLTSLHSTDPWVSSQLAGGIGIKYAPRKIAPSKKALPPPPPPPPAPLPPPPPVAPTFDATIKAVSLDENRNESDVQTLKVEEFFENTTHPLLNYIFFDENSATLPPRYEKINQKQVNEFSLNQFFEMQTLEVYYNVLNIIGKRMNQYPQVELTLIGCNSNLGKEENNLELSKNRAETVKNYLVNTWGIDPNRLKVEARNLPKSPSNNTNEDGIVENRRVEIIPNYDRIFEPVVTQKTFKKTNPPSVRFKTNVKAGIGTKSWKIETRQGGKTLRTFAGNGEVPAEVDWELVNEKEQKYIPLLDQPFEYKLIVTDNDGKIVESDYQSLPVKVLTLETKIFEMMADKEIDRFSMIGFGYNSDEILGANVKIATNAKVRVRNDSDVNISGHSDRTGNEETNLNLSTKRAKKTAEYMSVNEKFAKGYGERVLLYNNDLPEGRFYSRTVKIQIETPFEGK